MLGLNAVAPDALFDYAQPDTLLGPASALGALGPFDCVHDTVTSPDAGDSLNGQTYDEALRPVLAEQGMVVAINGSNSRWMRAGLGCQARGYRLVMKQRSAADLTRLNGWVTAGQFKAVLDSVHPFTAEGCAAAYARLKSRRSVGKVVVDVEDGGLML